MTAPLLQVENLVREYAMPREKLFEPPPKVHALNGVSFTIEAGRSLGIVGESGSGKSVTMMTVMRLINDPNAVFEGEVLYKGRDLMKVSQAEMRDVRGAEIAMIFQDPMTSLNPVYTVGWQIVEQLQAHEGISRRQAQSRCRRAAGPGSGTTG